MLSRLDPKSTISTTKNLIADILALSMAFFLNYLLRSFSFHAPLSHLDSPSLWHYDSSFFPANFSIIFHIQLFFSILLLLIIVTILLKIYHVPSTVLSSSDVSVQLILLVPLWQRSLDYFHFIDEYTNATMVWSSAHSQLISAGVLIIARCLPVFTVSITWSLWLGFLGSFWVQPHWPAFLPIP